MPSWVWTNIYNEIKKALCQIVGVSPKIDKEI